MIRFPLTKLYKKSYVSPTMASSITHGDITWTLDKSYRVGRYISGDWWVWDDGTGVTVNSVSPARTTLAWTAGDGLDDPGTGNYTINGSMKNPVFNSGSAANKQAFDQRFDFYDATVSVDYPVSLVGGDVLLSSKGRLTAVDSVDVFNTTPDYSHQFLLDGRILTVVSTIPEPDAFRPGYIGADRTSFRWSDVNIAALPSWTPVDAALYYGSKTGAATSLGASYYTRFFQGPHFLAWVDTTGNCHPASTMHWYYNPLRTALADAMLLCCTDVPDRNNLLATLIQVAIDQYCCGTRGVNLDRQITTPFIRWAGVILGHTAMTEFDAANSKEIDNPYYINEATPTYTSTLVPSGESWMTYYDLMAVPLSGDVPAWRTGPGGEYAHLDPQTAYEVMAVYYSGSADHATIECREWVNATDGTMVPDIAGHLGIFFRTYDSSNTELTEVFVDSRTFIASETLTLINRTYAGATKNIVVDGLYVAAPGALSVAAFDGWVGAGYGTGQYVTADLPNDSPWCRSLSNALTVSSATNCTNEANIQIIWASEWDWVTGRKSETYNGINTPDMVGFALALGAISALGSFPNPALKDWVNAWMAMDPTDYSNIISAVAFMDAPSKVPGDCGSAFIKQVWIANGPLV